MLPTAFLRHKRHKWDGMDVQKSRLPNLQHERDDFNFFIIIIENWSAIALIGRMFKWSNKEWSKSV